MQEASFVLVGSHLSASDDRVLQGQSVYTPRTLRFYDWLVLGLSNRFIWRCPTRKLRQLYDSHLSDNHLEVGVGTGYFLQRRFPSENPRLVLMDLNPHCLEATAERVRRYNPLCLRRNVLEPIPPDCPVFRSIGFNYVLHCLPGAMKEKAVAFDHLKPLLAPGGVLFGSTLLSGGVPRNKAARSLMAFYNRKGIFSNQSDSLEDLHAALAARFDDFELRTVGCAALFVARMAEV
jgi:hypothetical protein